MVIVCLFVCVLVVCLIFVVSLLGFFFFLSFLFFFFFFLEGYSRFMCLFVCVDFFYWFV